MSVSMIAGAQDWRDQFEDGSVQTEFSRSGAFAWSFVESNLRVLDLYMNRVHWQAILTSPILFATEVAFAGKPHLAIGYSLAADNSMGGLRLFALHTGATVFDQQLAGGCPLVALSVRNQTDTGAVEDVLVIGTSAGQLVHVTKNFAKELTAATRSSGPVTALSASTDGSMLFMGLGSGEIRVLNLPSLEILYKDTQETVSPSLIEFDNGSKRLWVARQSKSDIGVASLSRYDLSLSRGGALAATKQKSIPLKTATAVSSSALCLRSLQHVDALLILWCTRKQAQSQYFLDVIDPSNPESYLNGVGSDAALVELDIRRGVLSSFCLEIGSANVYIENGHKSVSINIAAVSGNGSVYQTVTVMPPRDKVLQSIAEEGVWIFSNVNDLYDRCTSVGLLVPNASSPLSHRFEQILTMLLTYESIPLVCQYVLQPREEAAVEDIADDKYYILENPKPVYDWACSVLNRISGHFDNVIAPSMFRHNRRPSTSEVDSYYRQLAGLHQVFKSLLERRQAESDVRSAKIHMPEGEEELHVLGDRINSVLRYSQVAGLVLWLIQSELPADLPLQQWQREYSRGRDRMAQFRPESNGRIMIDLLVESASAGVSSALGHYPPSSLSVFTDALKQIDAQATDSLIIRSVMFYFLLDVGQLNATRPSALADQYANMFSLDVNYQKLLIGFYNLDKGMCQIGIDSMMVDSFMATACRFFIDPAVEVQWSKTVLERFCDAGNFKEALQLYRKVSSKIDDDETRLTCLYILLENGLYAEAFKVMRLFEGATNGSSIITTFVQWFEDNKKMNELFSLPFNDEEEQLLIGQLSSSDIKSQEALVLYYLQRNRILEAIRFHNELLDTQPESASSQFRSQLLAGFEKILPPVQQKLIRLYPKRVQAPSLPATTEMEVDGDRRPPSPKSAKKRTLRRDPNEYVKAMTSAQTQQINKPIENSERNRSQQAVASRDGTVAAEPSSSSSSADMFMYPPSMKSPLKPAYPYKPFAVTPMQRPSNLVSTPVESPVYIRPLAANVLLSSVTPLSNTRRHAGSPGSNGSEGFFSPQGEPYQPDVTMAEGSASTFPRHIFPADILPSEATSPLSPVQQSFEQRLASVTDSNGTGNGINNTVDSLLMPPPAPKSIIVPDTTDRRQYLRTPPAKPVYSRRKPLAFSSLPSPKAPLTPVAADTAQTEQTAQPTYTAYTAQPAYTAQTAQTAQTAYTTQPTYTAQTAQPAYTAPAPMDIAPSFASAVAPPVTSLLSPSRGSEGEAKAAAEPLNISTPKPTVTSRSPFTTVGTPFNVQHVTAPTASPMMGGISSTYNTPAAGTPGTKQAMQTQSPVSSMSALYNPATSVTAVSPYPTLEQQPSPPPVVSRLNSLSTPAGVAQSPAPSAFSPAVGNNGTPFYANFSPSSVVYSRTPAATRSLGTALTYTGGTGRRSMADTPHTGVDEIALLTPGKPKGDQGVMRTAKKVSKTTAASSRSHGMTLRKRERQ